MVAYSSPSRLFTQMETFAQPGPAGEKTPHPNPLPQEREPELSAFTCLHILTISLGREGRVEGKSVPIQPISNHLAEVLA